MNEKIPLFRQYHRLHHMFFQCVFKMSGPMNVHPGQAALLGCLMDNGSMSQGELCRTLQVSGAAVAVSLRRLEQQGLVARHQNPKDLREKLLSLTPVGQKTAAQMHSMVQTVQRHAIAGFSQEELTELTAYLSRLTDNLRAFMDSVSPADPQACHFKAEQGE